VLGTPDGEMTHAAGAKAKRALEVASVCQHPTDINTTHHVLIFEFIHVFGKVVKVFLVQSK
jgi:hypothetical protein